MSDSAAAGAGGPPKNAKPKAKKKVKQSNREQQAEETRRHAKSEEGEAREAEEMERSLKTERGKIVRPITSRQKRAPAETKEHCADLKATRSAGKKETSKKSKGEEKDNAGHALRGWRPRALQSWRSRLLVQLAKREEKRARSWDMQEKPFSGGDALPTGRASLSSPSPASGSHQGEPDAVVPSSSPSADSLDDRASGARLASSRGSHTSCPAPLSVLARSCPLSQLASSASAAPASPSSSPLFSSSSRDPAAPHPFASFAYTSEATGAWRRPPASACGLGAAPRRRQESPSIADGGALATWTPGGERKRGVCESEGSVSCSPGSSAHSAKRARTTPFRSSLSPAFSIPVQAATAVAALRGSARAHPQAGETARPAPPASQSPSVFSFSQAEAPVSGSAPGGLASRSSPASLSASCCVNFETSSLLTPQYSLAPVTASSSPACSGLSSVVSPMNADEHERRGRTEDLLQATRAPAYDGARTPAATSPPPKRNEILELWEEIDRRRTMSPADVAAVFACPLCETQGMRFLTSRYGAFLGCARFPACRGKRSGREVELWRAGGGAPGQKKKTEKLALMCEVEGPRAFRVHAQGDPEVGELLRLALPAVIRGAARAFWEATQADACTPYAENSVPDVLRPLSWLPRADRLKSRREPWSEFLPAVCRAGEASVTGDRKLPTRTCDAQAACDSAPARCYAAAARAASPCVDEALLSTRLAELSGGVEWQDDDGAADETPQRMQPAWDWTAGWIEPPARHLQESAAELGRAEERTGEGGRGAVGDEDSGACKGRAEKTEDRHQERGERGQSESTAPPLEEERRATSKKGTKKQGRSRCEGGGAAAARAGGHARDGAGEGGRGRSELGTGEASGSDSNLHRAGKPGISGGEAAQGREVDEANAAGETSRFARDEICALPYYDGCVFRLEAYEWVIASLVEQTGEWCQVAPIPGLSLRFFRDYYDPAGRRENSFFLGNRQTALAIANRRLPPLLRRSLFPFQLDGVLFTLQRGGRALIGDQMGLGKTLQALALLSIYRTFPVLIVVPASLRLVWADAIERWLPELSCPPSSLLVIFGSDDRPALPPHLPSPSPFALSSPASSSSALSPCASSLSLSDASSSSPCAPGFSSPSRVSSPVSAASPASPPSPRIVLTSYEMSRRLADFLTQMRFQLVIVDESHKLRTPASAGAVAGAEADMTRRVLQLIKAAPYAVLLSGTPSVKHPFDLFSQIDALRPPMEPSAWRAHQARVRADWQRFAQEAAAAPGAPEGNAGPAGLGARPPEVEPKAGAQTETPRSSKKAGSEGGATAVEPGGDLERGDALRRDASGQKKEGLDARGGIVKAENRAAEDGSRMEAVKPAQERPKAACWGGGAPFRRYAHEGNIIRADKIQFGEEYCTSVLTYGSRKRYGISARSWELHLLLKSAALIRRRQGARSRHSGLSFQVTNTRQAGSAAASGAPCEASRDSRGLEPRPASPFSASGEAEAEPGGEGGKDRKGETLSSIAHRRLGDRGGLTGDHREADGPFERDAESHSCMSERAGLEAAAASQGEDSENRAEELAAEGSSRGQDFEGDEGHSGNDEDACRHAVPPPCVRILQSLQLAKDNPAVHAIATATVLRRPLFAALFEDVQAVCETRRQLAKLRIAQETERQLRLPSKKVRGRKAGKTSQSAAAVSADGRQGGGRQDHAEGARPAKGQAERGEAAGVEGEPRGADGKRKQKKGKCHGEKDRNGSKPTGEQECEGEGEGGLVMGSRVEKAPQAQVHAACGDGGEGVNGRTRRHGSSADAVDARGKTRQTKQQRGGTPGSTGKAEARQSPCPAETAGAALAEEASGDATEDEPGVEWAAKPTGEPSPMPGAQSKRVKLPASARRQTASTGASGACEPPTEPPDGGESETFDQKPWDDELEACGGEGPAEVAKYRSAVDKLASVLSDSIDRWTVKTEAERVGLSKVESALEWIYEKFLRDEDLDNEDDGVDDEGDDHSKLVIFAHHRRVLDSLEEGLRAYQQRTRARRAARAASAKTPRRPERQRSQWNGVCEHAAQATDGNHSSHNDEGDRQVAAGGVETSASFELIRIDGSVTEEDKLKRREKFRSSPRCRVALLSVTASSHGVDLSNANVCVFVELLPEQHELLQAEGRLHRRGQRRQVTTFFLLNKFLGDCDAADEEEEGALLPSERPAGEPESSARERAPDGGSYPLEEGREAETEDAKQDAAADGFAGAEAHPEHQRERGKKTPGVLGAVVRRPGRPGSSPGPAAGLSFRGASVVSSAPCCASRASFPQSVASPPAAPQTRVLLRQFRREVQREKRRLLAECERVDLSAWQRYSTCAAAIHHVVDGPTRAAEGDAFPLKIHAEASWAAGGETPPVEPNNRCTPLAEALRRDAAVGAPEAVSEAETRSGGKRLEGGAGGFQERNAGAREETKARRCSKSTEAAGTRERGMAAGGEKSSNGGSSQDADAGDAPADKACAGLDVAPAAQPHAPAKGLTGTQDFLSLQAEEEDKAWGLAALAPSDLRFIVSPYTKRVHLLRVLRRVAGNPVADCLADCAHVAGHRRPGRLPSPACSRSTVCSSSTSSSSSAPVDESAAPSHARGACERPSNGASASALAPPTSVSVCSVTNGTLDMSPQPAGAPGPGDWAAAWGTEGLSPDAEGPLAVEPLGLCFPAEVLQTLQGFVAGAAERQGDLCHPASWGIVPACPLSSVASSPSPCDCSEHGPTTGWKRPCEPRRWRAEHVLRHYAAKFYAEYLGLTSYQRRQVRRVYAPLGVRAWLSSAARPAGASHSTSAAAGWLGGVCPTQASRSSSPFPLSADPLTGLPNSGDGLAAFLPDGLPCSGDKPTGAGRAEETGALLRRPPRFFRDLPQGFFPGAVLSGLRAGGARGNSQGLWDDAIWGACAGEAAALPAAPLVASRYYAAQRGAVAEGDAPRGPEAAFRGASSQTRRPPGAPGPWRTGSAGDCGERDKAASGERADPFDGVCAPEPDRAPLSAPAAAVDGGGTGSRYFAAEKSEGGRGSRLRDATSTQGSQDTLEGGGAEGRQGGRAKRVRGRQAKTGERSESGARGPTTQTKRQRSTESRSAVPAPRWDEDEEDEDVYEDEASAQSHGRVPGLTASQDPARGPPTFLAAWRRDSSAASALTTRGGERAPTGTGAGPSLAGTESVHEGEAKAAEEAATQTTPMKRERMSGGSDAACSPSCSDDASSSAPELTEGASQRARSEPVSPECLSEEGVEARLRSGSSPASPTLPSSLAGVERASADSTGGEGIAASPKAPEGAEEAGEDSTACKVGFVRARVTYSRLGSSPVTYYQPVLLPRPAPPSSPSPPAGQPRIGRSEEAGAETCASEEPGDAGRSAAVYRSSRPRLLCLMCSQPLVAVSTTRKWTRRKTAADRGGAAAASPEAPFSEPSTRTARAGRITCKGRQRKRATSAGVTPSESDADGANAADADSEGETQRGGDAEGATETKPRVVAKQQKEGTCEEVVGDDDICFSQGARHQQKLGARRRKTDSGERDGDRQLTHETRQTEEDEGEWEAYISQEWEVRCSDNDLFCSGSCRAAFFARKNGDSLRRQVFRSDRGICSSCGVDCVALLLRVRSLRDEGRDAAEIGAFICSYAPAFRAFPTLRALLIREPIDGNVWHADHIVPVHRGGGLCGLTNVQTLCRACHQVKTNQEAAMRAHRVWMSRFAGGAVTGGTVHRDEPTDAL
ncbi:hypothetical protein BESB_007520 [Besnoitia besnoiti]|uniref:Helicase ATP-binding domain-containing protein n=1 Tax=Besnoitia besnoiti TaxID=94643 RepID=A0A2A9MQN4_BESBE|nr:hypothetical protein BESB_007520 [Besnoitia besnoiti]PFH38410.1 hypothetical protein BESB_007520 [Besnoitia besnoiti]